MWMIMIVAVAVSIYQIIKEKMRKEIPKENWNMKEFTNDIVNGVSNQKRMERLENGYYRQFNNKKKGG